MAIREDNRRNWLQNQWANSSGRSSTAWADRTGEHKHREFLGRGQSSLRAATGSLEESVQPLLLYWLSSRVKKVSMLCRYRAVTTDFNFMWNEIFDGISFHMKLLEEVVAEKLSKEVVANNFSKGQQLLERSCYREVVANQSHAHRFAQSCDHSLVSE